MSAEGIIILISQGDHWECEVWDHQRVNSGFINSGQEYIRPKPLRLEPVQLVSETLMQFNQKDEPVLTFIIHTLTKMVEIAFTIE